MPKQDNVVESQEIIGFPFFPKQSANQKEFPFPLVLTFNNKNNNVKKKV